MNPVARGFTFEGLLFVPPNTFAPPQNPDKMMRIVVLFTVLNFPLLAFAQRTALESQRMRIEAMVNRDSATLDKILAQELTYLHSNGLFETKTDFIQSICSGKLVYEQINIEKWQIRRTGRISVIQGIADVKGLLNGRAFKVRLKFISIYKKIKNRWKLIAWQSLKTET